MDIHAVRQQLRSKSIYDIPMRVTYYARVSSESDEQLNSLGNQIQYYEDLIRRNSAWTFVSGYIDEGLSGISTKKRENFNRMLEEAAEDRFDLIITKEISRLDVYKRQHPVLPAPDLRSVRFSPRHRSAGRAALWSRPRP